MQQMLAILFSTGEHTANSLGVPSWRLVHHINPHQIAQDEGRFVALHAV